MNKTNQLGLLMCIIICFSFFCGTLPIPIVKADVYNGEDLALAILTNSSVFISSSYTDTDAYGNSQATVLSSKGIMSPTHGSTFALFSTGIAGAYPVTTDQIDPGDERGSWFSGGKFGYPRDEVTLTMTLQVPAFMHYIYYDVQFLSAEYPEYVGTQYNDKLTITVNSPSEGTSVYIFDVNSGYFVLNSDGLTGTGFDVYATSGYPDGVDWISTTPQTPGADAGASDLIPIGGIAHPVSPHEQITVTINIKDAGDNLLDSAAFIDNLMFSGYAKTNIVARKTYLDMNGGDVECNDRIKYTITISNTGTADQEDNPGNEFEDYIPTNTTYVIGSGTATSGVFSYDTNNRKIQWNGMIQAESSVSITFDILINASVHNGEMISNQGTVYWDSNEDHTNDASELTDDPHIDDGIDQDGDGETNDDDPTNFIVVAWEVPDSVTEDFSDDIPGGKATQSYLGRQWFETTGGELGTAYQVVSGYYYQTSKSFKTKIRASGSPQYWNYSLSALEGDIQWWELWFACGNASEESLLYLRFKNGLDQEIAKLKFEYVRLGTNPPLDWVLRLYFWSPTITGWRQLNTDTSGYLYNNWYKLRIEQNGLEFINYSLYTQDRGLLDQKSDEQLGPPFTDLSYIEWSNIKDPVVCPMFFWDDHTIGLSDG